MSRPGLEPGTPGLKVRKWLILLVSHSLLSILIISVYPVIMRDSKLPLVSYRFSSVPIPGPASWEQLGKTIASLRRALRGAQRVTGNKPGRLMGTRRYCALEALSIHYKTII